jgi:hypothetical protein
MQITLDYRAQVWAPAMHHIQWSPWREPEDVMRDA